MKTLILLAAVFTCTAFLPEKKKIKIWMVGDSTMQYYEPSRSPVTGWGMPFAIFFDSTVSVNNRARGGRSTRTFISEGRWKAVADSLQEGDYVFMQFGHNDEAKEEIYKERYTPVNDYKTNLIKFITESRAKKAIPVLVTPASRMRFNKEGVAQETHIEYTAAVWEVGKSHNATVIDLDLLSRQLIQQLGPVHAKSIFMNLDSLEHPNYPAGQKDNTHFNEYGARKMAQFVLAGIRKDIPELAARIVKPPVKK